MRQLLTLCTLCSAVLPLLQQDALPLLPTCDVLVSDMNMGPDDLLVQVCDCL
jgi:hypothetical protein